MQFVEFKAKADTESKKKTDADAAKAKMEPDVKAAAEVKAAAPTLPYGGNLRDALKVRDQPAIKLLMQHNKQEEAKKKEAEAEAAAAALKERSAQLREAAAKVCRTLSLRKRAHKACIGLPLGAHCSLYPLIASSKSSSSSFGCFAGRGREGGGPGQGPRRE